MEKKFRDIIKRLAGDQRAVIAAVSGGLDSVVLARLLHDSGHLAGIAHCNFRLRDEEAEADARFVEQLAEKLGVPHYLKGFATAEYAQAHGISLQMAARELRYNWFAQLAEAQQALVATAHQANDVAETLLFNLTKGTGLPGLHGLDERQGYLLRPLLAFNRAEILQFAREQQIEWREDSSNQSLKYQRNRLRHRVVPELEQINPAFVQAAGRTALRLRQVEAFVQGIIDRGSFIEQHGNHLLIDLAKLNKLPGWQAVLYQVLRPLGFNYAQIDQLADGPHQSGKIFTSPTHQLNIDRQRLLVSPLADERPDGLFLQAEEATYATGPWQVHTRLVAAADYRIDRQSHIAALDADKLQFPLLLRPWQAGDVFRPLGMQGHKKVSDLLIDSKVPVNLKKDVMVLLSGDTIAWVAGYRLSEDFKITPATRQIFEISLHGNNDLYQ